MKLSQDVATNTKTKTVNVVTNNGVLVLKTSSSYPESGFAIAIYNPRWTATQGEMLFTKKTKLITLP